MLARLPDVGERPRLAHRRAIENALAAARCALRLTLEGPGEGLSRELLRIAVTQLDVVRGSVERLA
jgi:hypothetical protein